MPAEAVRRAAVVLASLPSSQAAALLAKLAPAQVQTVAAEMAGLKRLEPDEQRTAIRAFIAAGPGDGAVSLGDGAPGSAAGPRAVHADHPLPRPHAPFAFLEQIQPRRLAATLAEEHPQTIALILSYAAPRRAAAVLGGLPAEQRLPVLRRIARMDQPDARSLHDVAAALESALDSPPESIPGRGGIARAAAILAASGKHAGELLAALAEEDATLADQLRHEVAATARA